MSEDKEKSASRDAAKRHICGELRKVEKGLAAVRIGIARHPVASPGPEVFQALIREAITILYTAATRIKEI